ncbi:hypothetical protein C3747_338g46 [Trypanosoma cruzi]|uniref:Uncharacterized protein n=1 Tax=Trypanosoma cruzi TaxID=5693 RepID=A0A2V2V5K8_TRYCR|nr:hypothetical protein C3747_338g46 [Trypanosoma cruzi]
MCILLPLKCRKEGLTSWQKAAILDTERILLVKVVPFCTRRKSRRKRRTSVAFAVTERRKRSLCLRASVQAPFGGSTAHVWTAGVWKVQKRNMRNVNRCEICKKPFNISIRRRTLLWQSSRHLVLGVTLALSSVVFFFALTVFLRKTLGTISCRAPWRSVSYTTMFNLDGIMLTLFGYFMLVLLATFAFALVYSRWHTREEIEAHVQEFQALPEFWTFRNTTKVVAVYVIGIGQALCLGYLMKLWIYRTSNVVWNWEASPSIGAVLYMTFLTLGMSTVRAGREFFL